MIDAQYILFYQVHKINNVAYVMYLKRNISYINREYKIIW